MSLRYLDINPTPISDDVIYNKIISVADSLATEYKFNEEKIDLYINDVSQGSISCSTLSNGYIYAILKDLPIFYNNISKIYTNINEQEIDYAYTDNILFMINKAENKIERIELKNFNIWGMIDYFSSSIFVKADGWKYIGKKNNKIAIATLTKGDTGAKIIEYNGNKLTNLEGKDITFLRDEEGNIYAIFKVGINLYRYNFQDDFIDDNIILWGILPEDIEKFSIGAKIITQQGFQEFYLIDFANHKYYTATLTDTPPTPTPTPTLYTIRFLNYDGSLLETKEVEEGTTPTYTGSTPIREGYTFTGWTPALYPANKNQDYTAVFKQNARDVTINYKLSNSEDIFYTTTINNIINAITKIEIDTTLTFNVKFYTSDGSDYPTYYSGSVGGKDVLPYIESYKYGENTYLANKFNNVPTEISTNDTTEEITIIFNVGNDYHYKIQFLNSSVSPNVLHQVQRLLEGETPVFSGKTQPSKTGYDFIGWTPEIYPVDKDQIYQAQFSVESSSIITFKKKDGTTKTYSAVKFVKKDGTSKTYTKVRFDKV